MTTLSPTPSLVTAPDPTELSPLEALIMDACNELHEAVADQDVDAKHSLVAQLDELLDEYEATGGEDHPNAAWACPNQRALALSAAGELEEAIQAELRALRFADTPKRQEISLGNIAERLIRLERYEEAITFFLEASEVAATSVPILVTGAQALYGAGFVAESNDIFESLAAIPELLASDGELSAYLKYDKRLKDMAPDLPALAGIFRAAAEADHV